MTSTISHISSNPGMKEKQEEESGERREGLLSLQSQLKEGDSVPSRHAFICPVVFLEHSLHN